MRQETPAEQLQQFQSLRVSARERGDRAQVDLWDRAINEILVQNPQLAPQNQLTSQQPPADPVRRRWTVFETVLFWVAAPFVIVFSLTIGLLLGVAFTRPVR